VTKPINTLSSLIDTRRYIRSLQLSTEKHIKDLNSIKPSKTSRLRNEKNDKTRIRIEKAYVESTSNLRLIRHIQTTLKTHLFEKTRLNSKMFSQTDELLEKNKQLLQTSEVLMEAYIASTKIEDNLTLIKRDLIKKFSPSFYAYAKSITQGDRVFGVVTLQANSTEDIMHCVIFCSDTMVFKTFYNELPSYIDDQNFTVFVSPSQLYKKITEIMKTDGFS
jgi:hypothetical protein